MGRRSHFAGGAHGTVVWVDTRTPGASASDVLNAAADAIEAESNETHRLGDEVVYTLAAGVEAAAQRVLDAARIARSHAYAEQMAAFSDARVTNPDVAQPSAPDLGIYGVLAASVDPVADPESVEGWAV